jgi:hypothetical protein
MIRHHPCLQILAVLMPICSSLGGQDIKEGAKVPSELPQPSRAPVLNGIQANHQCGTEAKSIEIKNLKLFAWQVLATKKKYSEVQEFKEIQILHISPSAKFDVLCEVVAGPDLSAGDFLLWTTVDFLVAPVMCEYERMDDKRLSSSVGWGQVTEMQDLESLPIYFLRPGETRRLAVRDMDLGKVLAFFPPGDAGNLWPWLIRITVHIQDRSGKQISVADTTLRFSPSSARRDSHYHDPIPDEPDSIELIPRR